MILWKHLFKQLNKPTSYVMQFYHTTVSRQKLKLTLKRQDHSSLWISWPVDIKRNVA